MGENKNFRARFSEMIILAWAFVAVSTFFISVGALNSSRNFNKGWTGSLKSSFARFRLRRMIKKFPEKNRPKIISFLDQIEELRIIDKLGPDKYGALRKIPRYMVGTACESTRILVADLFDDLVKAGIKPEILKLAYNPDI